MTTCEVRLFYNGRIDYDTEYIKANCPIDLYNKAKILAKQRNAQHFNCNIAMAGEERKPEVPIRKPRFSAAPKNVKDQVKLIEEAIGLVQ